MYGLSTKAEAAIPAKAIRAVVIAERLQPRAGRIASSSPPIKATAHQQTVNARRSWNRPSGRIHRFGLTSRENRLDRSFVQ